MELQAAAGGTLGRLLFKLPDPILGRLAGERPAHARYLTADMWVVAKANALLPSDYDGVDVTKLRKDFEAEVGAISDRVQLPVAAQDMTVGGVPSRLYTPGGAPPSGPLLVYYHGGGWVVGSRETADRPCRWLAHLAGIRVLSVDYRLAPEHPSPAALDDARAAYEAVASDPGTYGAEPGRIAVGGDSAGGHLATLVALEADPTPAYQVLIYPVTDLSRNHPSVDTFANGFLLTKAAMEFYKDQYVPDLLHRADPRVSPLCAPDVSKLPPAYVALSITDPLLDEGVAYAKKMEDAGVHVVVQRHPLLHGFINLAASRTGRDGIAQVAGSIRALDTLSR